MSNTTNFTFISSKKTKTNQNPIMNNLSMKIKRKQLEEYCKGEDANKDRSLEIEYAKGFNFNHTISKKSLIDTNINISNKRFNDLISKEKKKIPTIFKNINLSATLPGKFIEKFQLLNNNKNMLLNEVKSSPMNIVNVQPNENKNKKHSPRGVNEGKDRNDEGSPRNNEDIKFHSVKVKDFNQFIENNLQVVDDIKKEFEEKGDYVDTNILNDEYLNENHISKLLKDKKELQLPPIAVLNSSTKYNNNNNFISEGKEINLSTEIAAYKKNEKKKKDVEVINYNSKDIHVWHLKNKYIKYRQLNKNHMDIKAEQFQNFLDKQINKQMNKQMDKNKSGININKGVNFSLVKYDNAGGMNQSQNNQNNQNLSSSQAVQSSFIDNKKYYHKDIPNNKNNIGNASYFSYKPVVK